MDAWAVAVFTFICVFGGALCGMWLQSRLKRTHLSEESKTSVTLVTGLMATLSALVLGLLISSSKASFDTVGEKMRESSAKTILIDRMLAQLGPEAADARTYLRESYREGILAHAPGDSRNQLAGVALRGSLHSDALEAKIRALPVKSEREVALRDRVLELSYEMRLARWTVIEATDIPTPPLFLAVLISWLTAMFVGFGMFAPRNRVSLAAFAVGALSMATSIFLVEEMSHPITGMIRVSQEPMLKVLDVLGK